MTYAQKVKLVSMNIFIKMFWDHENLFNRTASTAPTPAAVAELFKNSDEELIGMAEDFENGAIYALKNGDEGDYAYEMLWHLACVKVFYAKAALAA